MVKRMTKTERHQKSKEDENRVWNLFRIRLEVLQNFTEAMQLVNESPSQDAPGRRYFSNLGFFLGAFSIPTGSSYAEKALYLQFIQRLNATGQLKPAGGKKVEAELQKAMEIQGDG
jgi:hypothetical protein